MKNRCINPSTMISIGSRLSKDQEQSARKSVRLYSALLIMALMCSLMSCYDALDYSGNSAMKSEIGITQQSNAGLTLPHDELAQLRAAVARYHNMETAVAEGYDTEVTGYRTQMGFHYLNASLVDGLIELEKPEVLLYAPSPNGELRLVAVEYVTPIPDINNPPAPPSGFAGDADVWVINTEFNMWTLHVWIGLHNPHGIFASHNPRLP
jgi:hypothetical protein